MTSVTSQWIDLGIAWEWEYDKEFIDLICREAEKQGLSTLVVTPKTLDDVRNKVDTKELSFLAFLDRAGDVHETFAQFNKKLQSRGTWVINKIQDVERSRDKATMHLEFLTKGLYVPFTVILSPYEKDPELHLSELEKLGRPFIIKPACGGGGLGVVMGAENLLDVIEARKEFRQDKYLLQKRVIPTMLDGERAWFRSYYICGKVISCWWDDQTHFYKAMTLEHREIFTRLYKLREITRAISEVCQLNFFSTEIAIDQELDRFVVVDYVNEPCDMRLQSVHKDGVPDYLVQEVTRFLVAGVKGKLKLFRQKNNLLRESS